MTISFEAARADWLEARNPQVQPDSRIRTVVVDDSPAVLEALCGVLELGGLVEVVGTAQDGVEALQSVADVSPQLVLMDVNMPAMNGLQAASLVKTYFPDTKVVLMSGEDSPEVRQHCCQSGADGFVFKVRFPEELMPLLQQLFPEQVAYFTA